MDKDTLDKKFKELRDDAERLLGELGSSEVMRAKMEYAMLYREFRDSVVAACELGDPARVEREKILLRPKLRRLRKLQKVWHPTNSQEDEKEGVAYLLYHRLDQRIKTLHHELAAQRIDNAVRRLREIIPVVPEEAVPEEAYALVRQLRRESPKEEEEKQEAEKEEKEWRDFEDILEWQEIRHEIYQAAMAVRRDGTAGGEVVDIVLRPLVQHFPRCCSYAAALLGVAHGGLLANRDSTVEDLRERLFATVKQAYDEHRFSESSMHRNEKWKEHANEIATRLNAMSDALRATNNGIWVAEALSADFILLFQVMLYDGEQDAIKATQQFFEELFDIQSEDDPWQTKVQIENLLRVSMTVKAAHAHLRKRKLDEAKQAVQMAVDLAVEERVTSLDQLLAVARIHLNASWPPGQRGLAEAAARLENRLRRGDPARHETLKGDRLANIVAGLVTPVEESR